MITGECMYDIKRNDVRIPLVTTCFLNINGRKYSCLVGNISTTGALVELAHSQRLAIKTGDEGTLFTLLLSPIHLQCSVARVQANKVALQFISPLNVDFNP